MSREAWGDPPAPQAPRCPVCDGTEHTNDCELGEEMAKRRQCERELAEWREMALSQAGDAGLLTRMVKAETEAALLRAALDAETARWEEAVRLTWQMVDPLKPAGEPGSYYRGQDAGIVAALTTLRANLKRHNAP